MNEKTLRLNRQEVLWQDIYKFILKPAVVLSGAIITLAYLETFLQTFLPGNQNLDLLRDIAIAGVFLFYIVNQLLQNIFPRQAEYRKLNEALENTNRRHPDRYLYLDDNWVRKLFAYYKNLNSVPTTHSFGESNSLSGSASFISSQKGSDSSISSDFQTERLFESIEVDIKRDYEHVTNETKRFSGRGYILGDAKFMTSGKENSGIVLFYYSLEADKNEGPITTPVENLTPVGKAFANGIPIGKKVRIYGEIYKGGNVLTIRPIVIFEEEK